MNLYISFKELQPKRVLRVRAAEIRKKKPYGESIKIVQEEKEGSHYEKVILETTIFRKEIFSLNKGKIILILEEESEDLRELTSDEISLICSNLARGCEKQYLEEEKLFRELAQYYEQKGQSKKGTLGDITNQVTQDLEELKIAMDIADKYQDRGAKRIITWATKTSTIMKAILDNYQRKGIDYLKNTKIWVCDICGFVYVGDVPPEICPICKVPSLKILEVK